MLREDSYEEYPVFMIGKLRVKEKRIRIMRIQNLPYIQLILSNSRVKDIDISSAAKCFIKFNTLNFNRSIKLILARKKLQLYFNDVEVFNQCKRSIDTVLTTYHQERQSGSSSHPRTDSDSNQSDKSDSNSLNENNSPNSASQSLKPRKLSCPLNFLDGENAIFNKDYEIPEYQPEAQTMNGGYITLETFPFRNKNTFNDSNIFVAMKIREEVCNFGGVTITVGKHLIENIQVKVMNKKLWISDIQNWNEMNASLHVGDRIISVNERPVNDLQTFRECTKNREDYILIVQRLPKARVFVFDKNKLDVKTIKLEKNNFFLTKPTKPKDLDWAITEINRTKTVNINDQNIISNIQSVISSYIRYLAVIIHPARFIKNLGDG